jgi:hypothetical protein
MEFVDLLYLVVVAILTIFVAVSTVVFTFLQQQQLMVKRIWPLPPPKNTGQKTHPSNGPKTQG